VRQEIVIIFIFVACEEITHWNCCRRYLS